MPHTSKLYKSYKCCYKQCNLLSEYRDNSIFFFIKLTLLFMINLYNKFFISLGVLQMMQTRINSLKASVERQDFSALVNSIHWK